MWNQQFQQVNVGTNDFNSEKTFSQIAWSIINLITTLEFDQNIITASLIAPRRENLISKANKVLDCTSKFFQIH